jgi:hypothetical protein
LKVISVQISAISRNLPKDLARIINGLVHLPMNMLKAIVVLDAPAEVENETNNVTGEIHLGETQPTWEEIREWQEKGYTIYKTESGEWVARPRKSTEPVPIEEEEEPTPPEVPPEEPEKEKHPWYQPVTEFVTTVVIEMGQVNIPVVAEFVSGLSQVATMLQVGEKAVESVNKFAWGTGELGLAESKIRTVVEGNYITSERELQEKINNRMDPNERIELEDASRYIALGLKRFVQEEERPEDVVDRWISGLPDTKQDGSPNILKWHAKAYRNDIIEYLNEAL